MYDNEDNTPLSPGGTPAFDSNTPCSTPSEIDDFDSILTPHLSPAFKPSSALIQLVAPPVIPMPLPIQFTRQPPNDSLASLNIKKRRRDEHALDDQTDSESGDEEDIKMKDSLKKKSDGLPTTNKKLSKTTERVRWTNKEDLLLMEAVTKWGVSSWTKISTVVGTRTRQQCMRRYRDRTTLGSWTVEEDRKLILGHETYGSSWLSIQTAHLPLRSQNEIKNRFNSASRRAKLAYHKRGTPYARPLNRKAASDSEDILYRYCMRLLCSDLTAHNNNNNDSTPVVSSPNNDNTPVAPSSEIKSPIMIKSATDMYHQSNMYQISVYHQSPSLSLTEISSVAKIDLLRCKLESGYIAADHLRLTLHKLHEEINHTSNHDS